MTGEVEDLRAELRLALDRFDDAAVRSLCHQFTDDLRRATEPIDAETGLSVLRMLQRKRKALLVQEVAEALLAFDAGSVPVRHHYALAMLEDNRTVAAEALLASCSASGSSVDSAMDPEVLGALGRVHKQRYVTPGLAAGAQRPIELASAVETYERGYLQNPDVNHYHGINAAALLVRASADGLSIPGYDDARASAAEIARRILASVEKRRQKDLWDYATAAEACLVLGRHEDAVVWVARYVGSDADAFEYASTLRQFQQVWRLNSMTQPGLLLLPLLRNRLLQSEGGAFSVTPDEYTPASLRRFATLQDTLERRSGTAQYERVFGWERFKTINWLHRALEACRSVALVEDRWGDGVGTGFVLAGDQIHPGWPARVLLTNAHVVPDSVAADAAYVSFHGLPDQGDGSAHASGAGPSTRVRPVGNILWMSPKHEFDACFLALPDSLSDTIVALPMRASFPRLGGENQVRAYVIGHPGAHPSVRVSLHDSLVIDVGERYAHYRSPTEGGSSGSPVFDDNWQAIALHHGWTDGVPGAHTSTANEGIRLDKLITEVAG